MGMRDRIEWGFERWGAWICRRRWPVVLSMTGVALALASGLPRLRSDNSVEAFLHPDDPTLELYNEFRDQFGRDEYAVLAIETSDVFDLGFLERLRGLHRELERDVPFLDELTSLINVRATYGNADELIVEELMEDWPRDGVEVAHLRERVFNNPLYRDWLISEDGRLTTLVLKPDTYSTQGEATAPGLEFDQTESRDEGPRYLSDQEASRLIAKVREIMARHDAPGFRLHLAGGLVLGDRINERMTRDLTVFLSLSFLLIVSLLYLVFRRLSGVILPVLVVLLALIATLGSMARLDIPMSLTTQILPSFLLTVGICDSIHLLSIFYRELDRGADGHTAISYALGHSGLAVVMTSLTTAGGLASFAAASVAPIAHLGRMAPLGVLIAMVFSLTLLPALLALAPLRTLRRRRPRSGAAVDRGLAAFGELAIRRPWSVVLFTAALLALSGWGASRLELSQDELRWFPEHEPLRTATELIDRELRGVMSIEVLIDSHRENGLHDPEMLHVLDRLQSTPTALREGPLVVGKMTSLVDILKETHHALNENRPEFYAVPTDRELIAQELLLFENSGSDDLEEWVDSRFSLARIRLATPWVDSTLYPAFLKTVRTRFREALGEGYSVAVTGVSALFGRLAAQLLVTMARSYVIALLIITPLMIFLLGSIRRGFLSMIPNLTPVLLTLGLMGWSGVPLDISSLLVGGIIIGLAVDDTIHFMHRFNHSYRHRGDGPAAIHEALQSTGRAMLFTSLVLASGFLIFTLAYMRNLSTFGLLTTFATLSAFLADVMLAPALLVLVTRRRRRTDVARRSEAPEEAAIAAGS